MSGTVNGYVFPPPLLAHPPFDAKNLFRNSMVRGERQLQNYGGSCHRPSFNAEGQSWSPYHEFSCPNPNYRPQCIPRMRGLVPSSRKHAFPVDASRCKRFGRPGHVSSGTDKSTQNSWNTSDVAVKYALGMLFIVQAICAFYKSKSLKFDKKLRRRLRLKNCREIHLWTTMCKLPINIWTRNALSFLA